MLVVLGHLDTIFGNSIYKFHMAFFFIISGWCLKESHADHIIKFAWKRFVSILLPALLFSGTCALLCLLYPDYWNYTIEQYHLCGTIWFLKDLFKASILTILFIWVLKKPFFIREKLANWKYCLMPILFFAFAHIFSYLNIASPALNFYIASFYSLGFVLKNYTPHVIERHKISVGAISVVWLSLVIVMMSTSWAPGHITGCVWLNYFPYGILSLLGSYVAIQLSYFFLSSEYLKKSLTLIGQHTMPIVLWQWPCFWGMDVLKENGLVIYPSSLIETFSKFLVGIFFPLLLGLAYSRIKSNLTHWSIMLSK